MSRFFRNIPGDVSGLSGAFLSPYERYNLVAATSKRPASKQWCTHLFLTTEAWKLRDYISDEAWEKLHNEKRTASNRYITHGVHFNTLTPHSSDCLSTIAPSSTRDFFHWPIWEQPPQRLEDMPFCTLLRTTAEEEPCAVDYFWLFLLGVHDLACKAARVHLKPHTAASWIGHEASTKKYLVTLHWGMHSLCTPQIVLGPQGSPILGTFEEDEETCAIYGVTLLLSSSGTPRTGRLVVTFAKRTSNTETLHTRTLSFHPETRESTEWDSWKFFAKCVDLCLWKHEEATYLSHVRVETGTTINHIVPDEVDTLVDLVLAMHPVPFYVDVKSYLTKNSRILGSARLFSIFSTQVLLRIANWSQRPCIPLTTIAPVPPQEEIRLDMLSMSDEISPLEVQFVLKRDPLSMVPGSPYDPYFDEVD